jgi:hypothetical protein
MRALIVGAFAALLVAASAGAALGAAEAQKLSDTRDLTGVVIGGPECGGLITLTQGTVAITVVEVLRDGGESFSFVAHGTIRHVMGLSEDGTVYRILGPFTVQGSFRANGSGTFTVADLTRLISAGDDVNAIATFRFHASWDADGPHVEIEDFSLRCVGPGRSA